MDVRGGGGGEKTFNPPAGAKWEKRRRRRRRRKSLPGADCLSASEPRRVQEVKKNPISFRGRGRSLTIGPPRYHEIGRGGKIRKKRNEEYIFLPRLHLMQECFPRGSLRRRQLGIS